MSKIAIILILTHFSMGGLRAEPLPPPPADDIKKGETYIAEEDSKVLPKVEYDYFLKMERCCDKYTDIAINCMEGELPKKSKPLIGNPYFWGALGMGLIGGFAVGYFAR